mmetsp:Transcript_9852/g.13884  ORF Transcript_9852/g.13884 Transcript_9852/m.13884 type:complete len:134 (+) Transcript_9852:39-440(+)
MNKAFALLLASLTAIVSPALGFGLISPPPNVQSKPLFQQKASWSEYKDQHVEPNVPHGVLDQLKEDAEKAKEAHKSSDAFWAWQFEQDQEKLHHMDERLGLEPTENKGKLTESWSHYKHDHIDNLPTRGKLSP